MAISTTSIYTSLMGWTAPERHLHARIRLLSSSSEEAVHGRDYNDWAGFGEARVSGSWHRRRRPGHGAAAASPRRVAEVFREAALLLGWHGGLRHFALLGARNRSARAYGEDDAASLREALR